MTTIHTTTTKRFIAAFGIAAAGAVAPALLLAGAGTAHADDCYGDLAYSYYCSPAASGALAPSSPSTAPWDVNPFSGPPSTNLWTSLPGCTGGVLEALDGSC